MKQRKETGTYVFPKAIAESMKNISQRTVYEASMLSMVFIMFGLVFLGIYIPFFTDSPILLKIGTAVNCLAGLGMLGSWLVTTYQQYFSYLSIMGIIQEYEKEIQTETN